MIMPTQLRNKNIPTQKITEYNSKTKGSNNK